MPIRVPDQLPAVNFLREENVFVMSTTSGAGLVRKFVHLRFLILNLMPKKMKLKIDFSVAPALKLTFAGRYSAVAHRFPWS